MQLIKRQFRATRKHWTLLPTHKRSKDFQPDLLHLEHDATQNRLLLLRCTVVDRLCLWGKAHTTLRADLQPLFLLVAHLK